MGSRKLADIVLYLIEKGPGRSAGDLTTSFPGSGFGVEGLHFVFDGLELPWFRG